MSVARRRVLGIVLAAVGLGVVAWLLSRVGLRHAVLVLGRIAPVLPAVFVLEGLRIGAEAAALASLCERGAVAPLSLLRVHVVAYAVSIVAPAGRAAAEALKATMLAPVLGGGRAAAVGVTHQAVSLVAIALISIPCGLAAFAVPSGKLLALLTLAHAAFAFSLGAALAFAARSQKTIGWLARRARIADVHVDGFQTQLLTHAALPIPALAWKTFYRALQVVQCALMLAALHADAGLGNSLRTLGVSLVGTAAGDAIPGQLGATDGAFAAWAPLLSLVAGDALAISLALHLVQLAWSGVGAALPLLGGARATRPSPAHPV